MKTLGSSMSTPRRANGSMRAADTDRIQVAQLLTDAAALRAASDERV